MKKLLLALVAVCAMGNVDARCHTGRCHKNACEPKHCEKPVVREEAKPKCVKRCVVERCVAPIRHEEKIITYSCPTDCETTGSEYQPMHKDVTKKGKRMSNNY